VSFLTEISVIYIKKGEMILKNFFLSILFFLLISVPAGATPGEFNRYFIEAAGKAKPSVVNIVVYKESFVKGIKRYRKSAYGSGSIISEHGYIVTNCHVLTRGNYYRIICSDGRKFEAEILSNGKYYIADLKTDIAVLKIKNPENSSLLPIAYEDSELLREGEWVIAIGNPYGLKQSITGGIVSYKGRSNIGFADIEDFIQTDVPINPGNSGGPLINLYGKMVGMNTAIRTVSGGYQGISFAIPSNIIQQVCSELIRHGRVRRGWLGFIAKERKTGSCTAGSVIEVISVIKKSPSSISGIRKRDIIRKIDGITINTLGALVKAVGKKPVGSRIKILLSRNAKLFDVNLTLREKSVYKKIRKGLIDFFSRYGIEIDENAVSGEAVISYVSPRSIAYDLKRGDIIVSLNNRRISSLEDFIDNFYRFNGQISRMVVNRETGLYEVSFLKDGF